MLARCWLAARSALAEGWSILAHPSPVLSSDRKRIGELEEAFEAFVEEMRGQWRQVRRELQKELEGLEDVANVVERKRRRIAARESREKDSGANGGEQAVDPDGQDWIDARAAGLLR